MLESWARVISDIIAAIISGISFFKSNL